MQGVWMYRVDLFTEMKEILRQNTRTNLESDFDLVFRCEKLISFQNCEISCTPKYCDVRKSIQNKCSLGSRYFFPTTSVTNKAIFRHTLKFWSPTQYPLLHHKSLSPQLKAMGTSHKRPVLPPSTDSSAVDHENTTTNTFSAQLRY